MDDYKAKLARVNFKVAIYCVIKQCMIHFIQLGVARIPVINNWPPNVLASFFSFPSNLSRYFSRIAVVLWSSLFVT